jgi:galactokinase
MGYYCYILECADGSFYTGWTLNPERRALQHNAGKGAKYTRLHRPVKLVYTEEVPNRSAAMKRENAIKRLDHAHKLRLIQKNGGDVTAKSDLRPIWTVTSPARVNLLGEHVDYCDGLVLPAAIDRHVTLRARAMADQTILLHALDMKSSCQFSLESAAQKKDLHGKDLPLWAHYPAGVAWVFQNHGLEIRGVEVDYFSNIPIGAGLSSSAAVEVGFAVLWQALAGWTLDRLTLAQFCQEAENRYVGVNCGLMDQFACANGIQDHAVLLDTRSLEFSPQPLPPGVAIVIADSGVRRSLTDSSYNERRSDCETAARLLNSVYPNIHSLRDVTPNQLDVARDQMPAVVFKRARHVVTEIARVQQALICLQNQDARGFGKLMLETHASLRDDYEVSTPELDVLVESAMEQPGCMGARLTGAGFGGCTVNLVEQPKVNGFMRRLKSAYFKRTGRKARVFACHASQGAYATVSDSAS